MVGKTFLACSLALITYVRTYLFYRDYEISRGLRPTFSSLDYETGIKMCKSIDSSSESESSLDCILNYISKQRFNDLVNQADRDLDKQISESSKQIETNLIVKYTLGCETLTEDIEDEVKKIGKALDSFIESNGGIIKQNLNILIRDNNDINSSMVNSKFKDLNSSISAIISSLASKPATEIVSLIENLGPGGLLDQLLTVNNASESSIISSLTLSAVGLGEASDALLDDYTLSIMEAVKTKFEQMMAFIRKTIEDFKCLFISIIQKTVECNMKALYNIIKSGAEILKETIERMFNQIKSLESKRRLRKDDSCNECEIENYD